jgi:hypothetical protein
VSSLLRVAVGIVFVIDCLALGIVFSVLVDLKKGDYKMSGPQAVKPDGSFVASKLAELESRISIMERNALSFLTKGDNVIKRYAEILIPAALIVGGLIGHVWK